MPTCNLFISYSHRDVKFLEEIKVHVNNEIPNLQVWDDVQIELGDKWDDLIKKRITTADIVLLVLSQDFLNSKYIKTVELETALDRNKNAQNTVIPIFARDCDLESYEKITSIQGIPSTKVFLAKIPNEKDEQYQKLRKRVKDIAASMLDKAPPPRDLITLIPNLKTKKNIFLSIPYSQEGWQKRADLIRQAGNKRNHGQWNYDIMPGNELAEEIMKMPADGQKAVLAGLIKDAVYSIHIYDKENIDSEMTAYQYAMAMEAKGAESLFKAIIWMVDLADTVDVRKLLINPCVKNAGCSPVFDLIRDQDVEKQKIIDAFLPPAPKKRVYMFYDYDNDQDNPVRIDLKNKLERHLSVIGRNIPEEKLSEEKKIIDQCEAAIIFYGKSGWGWYVKRQDTLISENIKRAVCIDEPEFNIKLDRDVWKNEFNIIRGKGKTEFELDTDIFINQLKNAR